MKKFLIILSMFIFTTDSFASGIASNSASAPCTNNTLETYSGNSNLAADWAPNTIQLRWYNENEKLTVQQSAQTCTYDGTLTVPQTPPTRTGYTFAGWEVKHTIPAGYTELQYIEVTTLGPYIDTGFSPDVNTRVDYKVRLFPGLTEYQPIIGTRVGDDSPSRFFPIANSGDNACRTVFGTIERTFRVTFDIDYEGSFQPANNVSIINGESYSFAGKNFVKTQNNNLLLFGTTGYGSNKFLSKGRMYYVTIYDSGDLVRQFIPARRNSDNVLGMWDTVTQTFFTNAGTGTFTAGPVVQ